MAMQPSEARRLAVSSPYGNLRGIYHRCGCHEGKPAFVRVMKEGMDPAAATCIFFTSIFSCEARWYFGKYLPNETANRCSMESFCSAPGDAACPNTAEWPCEDILHVREATEEDENNSYFSPGPSRPRGFDSSSSGKVGVSTLEHLMILGLTKADFNMKVVRAAYRRLALALHPDRGGVTAKFQALQNAYEALVHDLNGESELARSQVGTPTREENAESEASGFSASAQTAEPMPELSEEEKGIRRRRAADAALRRQGQAS